MRRWPSRADYSIALDDPSTFFESQELRTCEIVKPNKFSNIKSTGTFACIAKAMIDGSPWALRLFLTEQVGVEYRYRAIESRLSDLRPYLVQFAYCHDEVSVTGLDGRFPLMRMQWIEGPTLGEFIHNACRVGNNDDIRWTRVELAKLRSHLRSNSAAHGDLSPENIIINTETSSRELKLVDYDSMWLPEIAAIATSTGLGPFQHPRRTNPIGPTSDEMAFEIFDLVLSYLEKHPADGIGPGAFDKQFLISARSLTRDLTEPSLVKLRYFAPEQFDRLLSYLEGDYGAYVQPTSPLSAGSTHNAPWPPPSTSDTETETVAKLAKQLKVSSKDILKLCNKTWPGNWSMARLLSPDQIARINNEFSTNSPEFQPDRSEISIFQLSEQLGIGTANIRSKLRELLGNDSSIPTDHHTPVRFPPEIHALLKQYSNSLNEERQRVTRRKDPTRWIRSVDSLAAQFGITAGAFRQAIQRSEGIRSRTALQMPALNHMEFEIDDEIMALIESAVSSFTTDNSIHAPRNQQVSHRRVDESVSLSPALRRILKENNLDDASMIGSGAGGRITREDVSAAIERKAHVRTAEPPKAGSPIGQYSVVKLASIFGTSTTAVRAAVLRLEKSQNFVLPDSNSRVFEMESRLVPLIRDEISRRPIAEPARGNVQNSSLSRVQADSTRPSNLLTPDQQPLSGGSSPRSYGFIFFLAAVATYFLIRLTTS